MEELVRDIRFGARTLLKHRGFALLAVLTLGLGIGANTAIFSVIDGVLLKPLPYANGDRLVLVQQSAPLAGRPNTGVSIKELYDYREQTGAFDALVEYHQMNFDLLKRGEPDRVNTGVVSHDFFNVLGIKPLLGRSFVVTDDAPGADAVLILSYSYWQTKFGDDLHIVGQVFEMNDRPHTVVGVLPNVPHYPQENDVYMPVSACPFRAAAELRINQNRRIFGGLTVFGRLKPGVSRERAAADVDAVCSRFTHENPTVYRPGYGFMATTLAVRDELTRNAKPMLLILLGTTGLILLIACANVANLTLARLLRRDPRARGSGGVGAGRAQLVRQLLTEARCWPLPAACSGCCSPLDHLDAHRVRRPLHLTHRRDRDRPVGARLHLARLDGDGLIFGTLPAQFARGSGERHEAGDERRRHQPRTAAAPELAHRRASGLSVVLLVGAGLLLASFYRLQQVDAGYRPDRVLSAEAFTNFSKYPDTNSQLRFYEPVLARLQAEPGVVAAAVTNAVPLSASTPNSTPFQIEGSATDDPDKRPSADVRVVTHATPTGDQLSGVLVDAGEER
jgi:putative ABC transport system permease protein